MSIRFILALIPLGLWWHQSFAQAGSERNAKEQEIIGNWYLVSLPPAVQPKTFNTDPWPSACQWYAYASNGVLKNINKTPEPCDNMTSAQIESTMAHVPAVISWKYDLSLVFNKALIIVTRSDVKDYAEYSEPHFVTNAYSIGDAQIQQGDLLLYLVNLQSKQITWIRHLRKLQ